MLVIRGAQMDALSADLSQRFTSQMVERLRALRTDALREATPTAVTELVVRGIKLARKYGIESAEDVASLLEIAAEVGVDFETVLEDEGAVTIAVDDARRLLGERARDPRRGQVT